MIVDKKISGCYRDVIRLGIRWKIRPALLKLRQSQLPTEEANDSRIITNNNKTKWIEETKNDHIKSIFNNNQ